MKISYYELLKMIKKGKYPIIEYNNIKYVPDFDIVDGSFLDYQIDKKTYIDDVKFYLAENFLDCEMFNKVLTIVEQDKLKGSINFQGTKNIIRKSIGLPIREDKKINSVDITGLNYNQIIIQFANRLNEIIDRLNGE